MITVRRLIRELEFEFLNVGKGEISLQVAGCEILWSGFIESRERRIGIVRTNCVFLSLGLVAMRLCYSSRLLAFDKCSTTVPVETNKVLQYSH